MTVIFKVEYLCGLDIICQDFEYGAEIMQFKATGIYSVSPQLIYFDEKLTSVD